MLVLLMCTLTILSYVLCVLMVEGMSVVVNVMLSLMSVMSPPPALCNLSLRTVVKLCTLVVLDFRGELGFLNCDDVCMCVVNKQFELLKFGLFPFMLTCSMMRFLSLLLLSLCPCVVSMVIWLSLARPSVSLSWYPMWMRWLL